MDSKTITIVAALVAIWAYLTSESSIQGVSDGKTSNDNDVVQMQATRANIGGSTFPDASTPSHVDLETARKVIDIFKLGYPFYFHFLPTEVVLGLIQTESSFRARIVGNDLEIGLTQVKSSTWADLQKRYKTEMQSYGSNPSDYQHQIFVGMLYLYEVSRIIGTNDLASVLTGYNVGPNGFLQGKRNNAYVQKIFGYAGVFTPVPTVSPASLPSNQSLIFGQNQIL